MCFHVRSFCKKQIVVGEFYSSLELTIPGERQYQDRKLTCTVRAYKNSRVSVRNCRGEYPDVSLSVIIDVSPDDFSPGSYIHETAKLGAQ